MPNQKLPVEPSENGSGHGQPQWKCCDGGLRRESKWTIEFFCKQMFLNVRDAKVVSSFAPSPMLKSLARRRRGCASGQMSPKLPSSQNAIVAVCVLDIAYMAH